MAAALNGNVRQKEIGASPSGGRGSRMSLASDTAERLRSASRGSEASRQSDLPTLEERVDSSILPPLSFDVNKREADKEVDLGPDVEPEKSVDSRQEKGPRSRARSPRNTIQRVDPAMTVLKRENEDLATKLRLIEKKRTEDREKLKELEKIQADRDRFEGIIQRLQAKYQPQQQEMANLRKQLKENESQMETLEAQQAENDTLNEMATLDREMAEEMAESAKSELQALRQRQEELELEVEVLREENQELGKEISPEEKTSQGWLQLERSNERYREALLRLRDVTQQQEADLRDQIADLEQDVQDYSKIKDSAAEFKERLLQSDSNVEDLRQQLDTALGAEDMIEELTQKNLTLSEQMDDLRLTIEELESLKELNDELEINHTETEKQLQDEIDYQDAMLTEEARKLASQDGTIQDLEYTVSRFRELVATMQNDLEDMKASQQITENQANELTTRSRAMEDLNLKLQSSAAKAQVKAIDIELGKLHAQESAEHLTIVQMFLPESFKVERDSVQSLLRFRRIEFKSRTLHDFIRERMGDSSSMNMAESSFFCNVLDKLTCVSSTSRRFINNLKTCDLESFKRLGAASFDLDPTERSLDRWLSSLKKGEFGVSQCDTELSRLVSWLSRSKIYYLSISSHISLLERLSEAHISDNLEHYADIVLHNAMMIQSKLENTAMLVSQIKSVSEHQIDQSDPEQQDEQTDVQAVLNRLDSVHSQVRSNKVISTKIVRQVEDLKSRNMTLEQSTLLSIEKCMKATSELALMTSQLLPDILGASGGGAGPNQINSQNLLDILQNSQSNLSSLSSKISTVSGHLHDFNGLTTSLAQAVEFTPTSDNPPWKILAQNMHAATAVMNAREGEIGQLKDQINDRNTKLVLKDKTVEEMAVKLEVLERNLGESGGHRVKMKELESSLEGSKAKEKDLLGKLSHLRKEYQILEEERERLKRAARESRVVAQPGESKEKLASGSMTSEASLRQIELLKAEIRVLQSSVRYLQKTASTRHLSDSLSFLSQPVASPTPPVSSVQSESQDLLHEMLGLITEKDCQVVALKSRPRADRLHWRPLRESPVWQVQKQKEEWEEWREWRNDLAKRVGHARRTKESVVQARQQRHQHHGRISLAQLSVQMPDKGAVHGEVKVRGD